MTTLTDLEINKRLALAIGWPKSRLGTNDGRLYAMRQQRAGSPYYDAVYFDYRDPAVIWPIAVKYDCFPKAEFIGWTAGESSAHTAAKAVALAVIGKAK